MRACGSGESGDRAGDAGHVRTPGPPQPQRTWEVGAEWVQL